MSTEIYRVIKEIGKGAYGKIFQGERVTDNVLVAIKISRSIKKSTESLMYDMLRNDNILEKFESITLNEIHNGTEYFVETMVLEYFPYDLHTYMTNILNPMAYKSMTIKVIVSKILNGVMYMHAQNIAHRDLKPGNILIDEHLNVKICDFGMAKELKPNQKQSLHISTPGYIAPEVLINYEYYDKSIDIWSIGCIMVELFMGIQLIKSNENDNQLAEIIDLCGPFSPGFLQTVARKQNQAVLKQPQCFRKLRVYLSRFIQSEKGIQVIDFMLQMDPNKRVKPIQALQYSFFR